MAQVTYDKQLTALLVIDPYNDFIAEGGKVWDRLQAVAEANRCVPHMVQVLQAARQAGLRVFYALHRRYRPGDYESWKYIAPIQEAAWSHKTFEHGTWGGEIRREFAPHPGDIVARVHWCSSGFAHTDLDVQLKQHGIHQLIVIGLLAHTCVESTVRFAAELGYEVTVVKDATASTRMRRCTPRSPSISRTTPGPLCPHMKSSTRSLLSTPEAAVRSRVT